MFNIQRLFRKLYYRVLTLSNNNVAALQLQDLETYEKRLTSEIDTQGYKEVKNLVFRAATLYDVPYTDETAPLHLIAMIRQAIQQSLSEYEEPDD